MGSPLSWAVYLAVFLASAALLRSFLRPRQKLNAPPGPRPWPVIGSLHLLGPLPHQSFHQLSRKYGPIMQLRLGSRPVIVASSAEAAELFLKTHDLAFAYRPRTTAGKHTTYNYANITWSPYGPYWRQARKVCLTELFSAKRLEASECIRTEELRRLLRNLYGTAGRALALREHLSTLSLNVICRMVMGRSYTEISEEAPEVSPEEFKEMIDELMELNGVMNVGDFIPLVDFLDLQGYVRRMKALSKRFDVFLERVLREHDERRRRSAEESAPQDMVDVLLQLADGSQPDVKLTRDGVKAFTLDMIGGGTETSATVVEWAISELLRRPDTFDKAGEELDRIVGRERWVEEKDLPHLSYIQAVVKETMRLHPAAPLLVPHYNQEDCCVAGYDIPAFTVVLVNVWSIGRDPAAWDAPGEFRPERLEGRNPAADAQGRDLGLLPFGAGRRMCPGWPLGLKLVLVTLANLLHGFTWRLPEGTTAAELSMEERFGLTLPRKVPLVVVVEPRLPSHLYNL